MSSAELRVFDLLRRTDWPEAVAFHSLRLDHHSYKSSGEIDFLIVTTDALIVLEVKGGRVARHGGVWVYTDRYGVRYQNHEGPFEQARSAMYSLRGRLADLLADRRMQEVPFGIGVAVPDVAMHSANVEWDPATVADVSDLRGAKDFARPLRRMVDHAVKTSRGRRGTLTRDLQQALVEALRPDFDLVPSLATEGELVASRLLRLTESQYAYLDATYSWDRLAIEGGAGSGKTLLAVETSRRESNEERSVLLTCHSSEFASFLRGRVDSSIEVVPFDKARGTYDVVVVDEAQDLMSVDALDRLDRLVDRGLAAGRWRVFMDMNNQARVSGRFDQEAFDVLLGYASAPVLHLPDNCRNTALVVRMTQVVTAADLGVARVGAGPPVRHLWAEDPARAARQLEKYLLELRDHHDVPPGQVTVLSLAPGPSPLREHLRPRVARNVVDVTDDVALRWPVESWTWSTPAGFKGMENSFVVVVDVDAVDVDRDRHLLYVALSRPNASLAIIWPEELRDRVAEVMLRAVGGGQP